MAKKTTTKTEEAAVPVVASKVLGPRVTEKAAYATERGQYVFDVALDANKIEIKKAIAAQYKVTPVAINIVVSKPKAVTFRGRKGTLSASKKAYVTLKKGETIEIS